jgi:hypothetical protein|nr:hypothetical protein [uncultured Psychroserpens sp.]
MKRTLLIILLVIPSLSFGQINEWMTSIDAAKRLALVQNKMILMTWEESTQYPLPVTLKDKKGRPIFINDLFESDYLIDLLREHFILLKVNESDYIKLFEAIDGKRSMAYIDKFNDDSLKVMDANGTIVNMSKSYKEFLNLAIFIQNYAISTEFIKAELTSYQKNQNFVTSFRLASKYLEMTCYVFSESKKDFVDVSILYLDEAEAYLVKESMENKEGFQQKIELQRLEQELVLGNPRKVLRKLKRFDPLEINSINKSLVSFLYFTSYIMLKDETNAAPYRSDISLVDLNRANAIMNTNDNP